MKLTAGRITAVGGLAATASLVFLMAGADAHHPELTASSVCSNGLAEVRINTFSWDTEDLGHRYNSNVEVTVGNVVAGRGAFTPANNYAFSLVYRTPADGSTRTVRATALVAWGPNGEFGYPGEFRDTTVTLPTNCVVAATTSTTTTAPSGATTTTTAPTGATTTAPTTTAANVPVIVGGQTETRPDVAPPIVLQPRFAG